MAGIEPAYTLLGPPAYKAGAMTNLATRAHGSHTGIRTQTVCVLSALPPAVGLCDHIDNIQFCCLFIFEPLFPGCNAWQFAHNSCKLSKSLL